jgi:phage protein D
MIPGLEGPAGARAGRVDAPRFAVVVEGVPVPPSTLQTISAVAVTQDVNQPAGFHIDVHDPDLQLIGAGGGLFAEGRRIEIAIGYAGSIVPVLDGEVTAIDVSLDETGGLTLRVEGFDWLHSGARGRTSRSFREGQSDSAIVRQVASEVWPTALVDETPPRSGTRAQTDESNLAFLQRLARENRYQIWTEGRMLFFVRARLGPPATFTRGRNLIAFSTRLSTAGQASSVRVLGWDTARQREIKATAAAGRSPDYMLTLSSTGQQQIGGGGLGSGEDATTRVIDAQGSVTSIDEAQALAEAEMDEQRRNLLTARGTVVGDPRVRVGSVVALVGMGRFGLRPFVVEHVGHTINQSGYQTAFGMRQLL